MKVTIEGKELVIRIPMQDPKPSASGKSLTIASTHGIVPTEVSLGGKVVKIGINAFIAA